MGGTYKGKHIQEALSTSRITYHLRLTTYGYEQPPVAYRLPLTSYKYHLPYTIYNLPPTANTNCTYDQLALSPYSFCNTWCSGSCAAHLRAASVSRLELDQVRRSFLTKFRRTLSEQAEAVTSVSTEGRPVPCRLRHPDELSLPKVPAKKRTVEVKTCAVVESPTKSSCLPLSMLHAARLSNLEITHELATHSKFEFGGYF